MRVRQDPYAEFFGRKDYGLLGDEINNYIEAGRKDLLYSPLIENKTPLNRGTMGKIHKTILVPIENKIKPIFETLRIRNFL